MDAPGAFREHIADDPRSPWWAEHRARYAYAAAFAEGRLTLDVACGSGLGTDLLVAGTPRALVSGDLDGDALARVGSAAQAGGRCQLDITRLPFPDDVFDLVTCFETIEHVPGDGALLDELKRVAAPGATVLISTPNALVTRPRDGVPRNPFHVREYGPSEFASLLHSRFEDVRVLGQRPTGRHRDCAFWVPPVDRAGQLRAVTLKVALRLPMGVRRGIEAVFRRPLFPGSEDFAFGPQAVDSAHALLAVCR